MAVCRDGGMVQGASEHEREQINLGVNRDLLFVINRLMHKRFSEKCWL